MRSATPKPGDHLSSSDASGDGARSAPRLLHAYKSGTCRTSAKLGGTQAGIFCRSVDVSLFEQNPTATWRPSRDGVNADTETPGGTGTAKPKSRRV
eukprot:CAMPEP_0119197568 /NCGR_PEP_ID=MMETSP1316-20130426/14710_1 /TAXON_ID=41880 /ORGANISM="Pycnococcus provasolii, Strain RCC2336" /LENGTH=95 /DNA_ID=CAMNT_0007193395 /DNA_START=100 /DNA_END=387 /DNA_ORIENTATION=-